LEPFGEGLPLQLCFWPARGDVLRLLCACVGRLCLVSLLFKRAQLKPLPFPVPAPLNRAQLASRPLPCPSSALSSAPSLYHLLLAFILSPRVLFPSLQWRLLLPPTVDHRRSGLRAGRCPPLRPLNLPRWLQWLAALRGGALPLQPEESSRYGAVLLAPSSRALW
jgi:hypothetical protein